MSSVSLHVLMSLYVFNIKVSKYKKCEKNEISRELHHIVNYNLLRPYSVL